MDSDFKQCFNLVQNKLMVINAFADKAPAGDILCALAKAGISDHAVHSWLASYLASLDPRSRISPRVYAPFEESDTAEAYSIVTVEHREFYGYRWLHDYSFTIARAELIQLFDMDDAIPAAELYDGLVSDIEVTSWAKEGDDSFVDTDIAIDLARPLSSQLTEYVECDADTLHTFAVNNMINCMECINIVDRAGSPRVWVPVA